MTPIWADHLYVVGILLLVMPIVGTIAYRRFLARRERIGGRALVIEYRTTLLWQVALAGLPLLIWWITARPLAALFATRPVTSDGGDFAMALAIGAGIGLAARPLLALVPPIGRTFARQMTKLAPFLPRTVEQLCWGLAVSLAAGLCEEIAYRGYLMAYLGHWLPWGWQIAGTAAIFGIAHAYQGKTGVMMTSVVGAGLGALYVVGGSLWPAIALHAALDVSVMLTAFIVLRETA
ncbi:CPBP family intramembrane glutamic endopeptidase [Sphingomonas oryzagri]|jgi:membrane protease YdiL (CAAX protease family)|uniref:CPBP family intramembrane metalloprotease n=1 Tax=Sphingomonas oryzagri TaxID=3042314 RepID=A0ABT6N4P7_9SPHN|nr:CPBP family intramembrane glutamic endopeptidase [Sphingomonas oryzagri]MDH7639933.1 CPBP family intramembrane metalloprotease [Sphingomonas oryzagri]